MKVIENRSRRIAHFARDTQSFMSISSPNFRTINLNDLLNRTYSYLLPSFNNDGISLLLELPTEEIKIEGDFEMLEQAFINILRNSQDALMAEHPSADPRVIFSLSSNGTGVQILIEDNGPGISEEDLENIFVPFFTTKEGQTGIGLAIARHIIYLNRGKLFVRSERNKKTRFHITF
jgi:signal transduction histidine kinase